MKLKYLPLLVLPLILNGCASVVSRTDHQNKDGTHDVTTFKARTLFDSNSSLAKGANHITDKTSGTTINSLDQSASSTNFLQSLQEVSKIITAIPK